MTIGETAPAGQPVYSYDKASAHYDASRHVPRPVLARLAERLCRDTPGPWLDVGTGTGRAAIPMAEAGASVTGIDIAPRMLARISDTALGVGRLHLVLGDFIRMPFRSGSFAAGIGYHVLHLVRDPAGLLREIARVLRPGAPLYWLADMPDRDGIYVALKARYAQIIAGRHPFGKPSSRDTAFVESALTRLDLEFAELPAPELRWERRITTEEQIALFEAKAYSALFAVPDEIHAGVMRDLKSWARSSLPGAESLPIRIRVVRISMPGARAHDETLP